MQNILCLDILAILLLTDCLFLKICLTPWKVLMPWDKLLPGCVGVAALKAGGGEFTNTRSGFSPGTSHAWMCKARPTFCAANRNTVRAANPRGGFKLTLRIYAYLPMFKLILSCPCEFEKPLHLGQGIGLAESGSSGINVGLIMQATTTRCWQSWILPSSELRWLAHWVSFARNRYNLR